MSDTNKHPVMMLRLIPNRVSCLSDANEHLVMMMIRLVQRICYFVFVLSALKSSGGLDALFGGLAMTSAPMATATPMSPAPSSDGGLWFAAAQSRFHLTALCLQLA